MFLSISQTTQYVSMSNFTNTYVLMAQCALVHSNVGKQCNIHVKNNNPHNKIRRKILLDITLCKQCTFNVNNSILNQHTLWWGNTFAHNGRKLDHSNNHPTLPKY